MDMVITTVLIRLNLFEETFFELKKRKVTFRNQLI